VEKKSSPEGKGKLRVRSERQKIEKKNKGKRNHQKNNEKQVGSNRPTWGGSEDKI